MYKEDFEDFSQNLDEMTNFIIHEKGEEVISERHQADFNKEDEVEATETDVSDYTDISFDDI